MAKPIAQNSSANVVVGPVINVSGSVMTGLAIANTAIVLVKENGASAARSQTTSAASVGPALYRVVLNTADTNTMGTLAILVSGSGALPFRYDCEIWQSTTHALYYGSANQFATSAAVSVIVSAVLDSYNVASAGEVASAGINSAGISAIVNTALTNADIATSADVSAVASVVVAQALSDYAALVSANLSAGVDAVLVQRGLHMLVDVSASVPGVHDNSLIGMTWASVSANAFDRTTDSLRAIAQNVGGGAGLTSAQASTIMQGVVDNNQIPSSAEVSVIVGGAITNADLATSADVSAVASVVVAQALSDYAALVSANLSAGVDAVLVQRGLHMLVDVSASVPGVHDNSLIGMTWASTSANAFDRTTDSLRAISQNLGGGAGLTSAQASTIMQGVVDNNQIPSSAEVSVIIGGAITNADLATSADVSVVVSGVLASYNVASAGELVTQAEVSAAVSAALTNYNVASAGDLLTSNDVSAAVSTALTNYNAASAGDLLTSAQVSVIVAQGLSDYDGATSADVSVIVSGVLASYNVASAGDLLTTNDVSAVVSGVLASFGVASAGALITSAQVSAIGIQVLTDYDAPTSADVSVMLSAGIEQAVWQRTLTEPVSAPHWGAMQADDALGWQTMRALNRHHQASTSVAIYSSADSQVASASVNITSTSANQSQWL